MGEMRETAQLLDAHAGLEMQGVVRLQHQRRNERDEIGIAAALAQAVERALHLPDTGADRGEAVGDGVLGVVMGMDAELAARHMLRHLADDALDLVRQAAAIGVAQHEPARAGRLGRLETAQRVIGIGLVAVEEMLGVEKGLAAARDSGSDRFLDERQVLLERYPEDQHDVEIPGLADEAAALRLGIEDGGESGIVGSAAARALGHAEGDELRVLKRRRSGKKCRVGRIGAGPPAFDVIDADAVELLRDVALVRHAEIDALRLRAIAQSRVEQIKALAGHPNSFKTSAIRSYHPPYLLGLSPERRVQHEFDQLP
jgi:hypothetical protein